MGGTYTITAQVLLAVTVTADDPPTATATARARLAAELDQLAGVTARTDRMRPLGLRRLTDLDQCQDGGGMTTPNTAGPADPGKGNPVAAR